MMSAALALVVRIKQQNGAREFSVKGIPVDDAILLPRGLGSENPAELFRICSAIRNCREHIDLDASQLAYIDPLGMATLRALLEEELLTKHVSMNFLPTSLTSYLARMDFFKDLDIEGVDLPRMNRNDQSGSLVEITKVTEHYQAEIVASRLANALTGRLTNSVREGSSDDEEMWRNIFDSYRRPIEYSLKELLENSLTHARREGRSSASVWVACQYYPKKNLVRMAIVDNGCGFLATLRSHPQLADKSHQGAIEAALKPRISCNRGATALILGSENQGIGLTTTAGIARAAGGGLIVVSGDAIHNTTSQTSNVLETVGWDGVSIGFTCKRDLLPAISISDLLPFDPASGPASEDLAFLQFR